MYPARIYVKYANGVLGDLRKDLLGAGIVEFIEHSADIIITEKRRFEIMAQDQIGVLFLEKLLEPVKRGSS